MKKPPNTSWQEVAHWYDKLVNTEGHYFHKEIIFPHLAEIFDFSGTKNAKVLDVGAGNGILASQIPKNVGYLGLEYARSLVAAARKKYPQTFLEQDVTKPFSLKESDFSHAVIILALQNMSDPKAVFANLSKHLRKNGKLVIVLNHPCFRIPRQSHWGIDEKQKIQFRRIDRYLSPLKIPIQMNPGKKGQSETTFSFHFPLSTYINLLSDAGFVTLQMHEWSSNKLSMGKLAKMENRAREEFPLFLCLVAEKK